MATNNRKKIREQLNVITNDLARSFPRYGIILDMFLPYATSTDDIVNAVDTLFEFMATVPDANLEVVYKYLVSEDEIPDLGHYWKEIISIATFYKSQEELQQNVQDFYNHY